MLDKVFKLSANGTNIRTEVVAGITSFMAMAYIIALNPNILTGFNSHGQSLWNAIFVATCLSSAIAMFCMAFLANKPFCLAPCMGLNNFFAIITANMVAITGLTYLETYQTMLCLILFDGVLFLLLTIFNIREKIITAIPPQVRLGIAKKPCSIVRRTSNPTVGKRDGNRHSLPKSVGARKYETADLIKDNLEIVYSNERIL